MSKALKGILAGNTATDKAEGRLKKEVKFAFNTTQWSPRNIQTSFKVSSLFQQRASVNSASAHTLGTLDKFPETKIQLTRAVPQMVACRKGKKRNKVPEQDMEAKMIAKAKEEEEVKNLEKWEQKSKGNMLNFYVFNLTTRIQGKIMHEDKGPSINLKNINFINKVEHYNKSSDLGGYKAQPANKTFVEPKPRFSPKADESKPVFEQDYFVKHTYMLQDKMLETFKDSASIPTADKKTIEEEFNNELKELKESLKEIKAISKALLVENNEKHAEIERLSNDILKDDLLHRKMFIDKRKEIGSKYALRVGNTGAELAKFMTEREKLRRAKEEKVKHKHELKAGLETNKENVKVFEAKVELIKNKIIFVKGILKEYYINLLKQGTDTRGKGLIWIIQRLAKLGVALDPSMLPQFLVPLSIDGYFEACVQKEQEITELLKEFTKFKGQHLKECSTHRQEEFSKYRLDTQKSITSFFTARVSTKRLSCAERKNSNCITTQDYEREITRKKYELQNIKKEQAKKLGKYFAELPLTLRKHLLPRIVAALFGESTYEIEVLKHAQAHKVTYTATIKNS